MARHYMTAQGKVPFTAEEEAARDAEEAAWAADAVVRNNAEMSRLRQVAYKEEADALFLKAQRGEATMQEWLDKVAAIKAKYPKSE